MCKYFILLLLFVCVNSRILCTFVLSQINSYYLCHVRPSVGKFQLTSHWTDFCGISCWEFLLKSVEKIKIWFKSGKNIGNLSTYCCRCDSKLPLRRSIQLKSYHNVISCVSLSVCASICPRVSARLALYGFTWNFMMGTCLKICRGIPYLFKNRRKIYNCSRQR